MGAGHVEDILRKGNLRPETFGNTRQELPLRIAGTPTESGSSEAPNQKCRLILWSRKSCRFSRTIGGVSGISNRWPSRCGENFEFDRRSDSLGRTRPPWRSSCLSPGRLRYRGRGKDLHRHLSFPSQKEPKASAEKLGEASTTQTMPPSPLEHTILRLRLRPECASSGRSPAARDRVRSTAQLTTILAPMNDLALSIATGRLRSRKLRQVDGFTDTHDNGTFNDVLNLAT